MKAKTSSLLTIAALAANIVYADTGSNDYRVATRMDSYEGPAAFTPAKAAPVNGAISENIFTSTDRILNKEAPFLKKGIVKPVGEDQLSAWQLTSGEGLANKTAIDSATVVDESLWADRGARPGQVGSPVSVDNGTTITDVTPDLNLQTVEIEEDLSLKMNALPKTFEFSEIGIAESAHDAARPYMHRVRAKSLTENYATWDLYTDDSRGYEGIEKAPSSWDYFTIGTSFCLMSQLTPNQMYFKKLGVDVTDFRVEHQFNYRQEQFMTPTMTGQFGDVITRMIVKGNASEDALKQFAAQSLRCCFAGEGIMNATEMETTLYLNGKIVK